jgi:predicted N-formylglutamate amidohydrolase
MAVARRLSERLNAPLVAAAVSRLIYDCNRPPEAPDAMPAQSEVFAIPGNADLSDADRAARIATYYAPFRDALSDTIAKLSNPVIVTLHSFTPIYHGQSRAVEIGVLHDRDSRMADAMLDTAGAHTDALVLRNAPYGPEHGVTHTLREHAIAQGHMNVMLEIRNDLIRTPDEQTAVADMIANWIADAFARTQAQGAVTCGA